jgi:hypothetical protein
MEAAFDDLLVLSPEGIQLTPGNHPTVAFEQHVGRAPIRTHHGFSFTSRKRDVWSSAATCAVLADSVHPPLRASDAARCIAATGGLGAWLERSKGMLPILETMFPDYLLGTGAETEVAMVLRVPLAVDVSHVFIQLETGAMTLATWRRLAAYDLVSEVHVSANAGHRDSHLPLTRETFGLAWVRERHAAGVPGVFECYLHKLSFRARMEQLRLALGRE